VAPSGTKTAPAEEQEQVCPGLGTALAKVLAGPRRPEILDLGQPCRATAVYLADRGARVFVDDFAVPEAKKPEPGAEAEAPQPLALPHEDARFDLVLAWDHADHVPPERLAEFGAELSRILAPGGWLVLFARDTPGRDERLEDSTLGYRMVGDDRLVRVPSGRPAGARFSHPNRAIEKAVAPLKVHSVHLQRSRVREFLLHKPTGA
jgi:SAM-dependent methyltransferase